MPKLIDADKLLAWIGDQQQSYLKPVLEQMIEGGVFDPTPAQPDEPSEEDIKEISGMLKQMKYSADSIAAHLDHIGEVIKDA